MSRASRNQAPTPNSNMNYHCCALTQLPIAVEDPFWKKCRPVLIELGLKDVDEKLLYKAAAEFAAKWLKSDDVMSSLVKHIYIYIYQDLP